MSILDVNMYLKKLDKSKATGLDDVGPNILSMCSDVIAPALTYIFNLSIKSGKFPSIFKTARVCPIFKSGDACNPDNYRPIAVLPCLSKIIERHIANNVTYIGCFEDPPIIELISPPYTRILEASYIEDQSMTIPGCLSICLDEGHTFAAREKCFCDSVITKHLTLLQLPNTECMTPCVGNATQHCGATYKLALYQLNIFPESTSSIEHGSSSPMIAASSTLTTSHFTTQKSTSTGSEAPDTTSLINMETTAEPSASTSTETSALFFH
ncbi:unnamed protein product [Mytilus edulis]|uniref:WSC domain-containing protein n=1 Tax=Mytilus edulis TaxID=6550 RepID=A0A8S3SB14_MYTED|nr:unnamed protein product [Mytilus edulis]